LHLQRSAGASVLLQCYWEKLSFCMGSDRRASLRNPWHWNGVNATVYWWQLENIVTVKRWQTHTNCRSLGKWRWK
jgi:hypothetical protein